MKLFTSKQFLPAFSAKRIKLPGTAPEPFANQLMDNTIEARLKSEQTELYRSLFYKNHDLPQIKLPDAESGKHYAISEDEKNKIESSFPTTGRFMATGATTISKAELKQAGITLDDNDHHVLKYEG